MKPEEITVSLEMAKKLKEAGWDKRTVFFYVDRKLESDWVGKTFNEDMKILMAPTFQEIWVELPKNIGIGLNLYQNNPNDPMSSMENNHWIGYFGIYTVSVETSVVDAAAKAWLWCKENKYI